MKNEPVSFDGILWGESSKNHDLKLLENAVSKRKSYYKVGSSPLNPKGDAVFFGIMARVRYLFYDDQFYRVIMSFRSIESFNKAKDFFFEMHGDGTGGEKNFGINYSWEGDKIRLMLSYNKRSKSGMIVFDFIPLYDKEGKELDKLHNMSRDDIKKSKQLDREFREIMKN